MKRILALSIVASNIFAFSHASAFFGSCHTPLMTTYGDISSVLSGNILDLHHDHYDKNYQYTIAPVTAEEIETIKTTITALSNKGYEARPGKVDSLYNIQDSLNLQISVGGKPARQGFDYIRFRRASGYFTLRNDNRKFVAIEDLNSPISVSIAVFKKSFEDRSAARDVVSRDVNEGDTMMASHSVYSLEEPIILSTAIELPSMRSLLLKADKNLIGSEEILSLLDGTADLKNPDIQFVMYDMIITELRAHGVDTISVLNNLAEKMPVCR